MILKVNKDICEIKQNEVWNVGDYNVHTVQVELSEEFDGLVNKVRYFTENNSYDMLITDNIAEVPYEATLTEGTIKIGVYGYDADTNILVQSTSPVNKYISSGTYTGEADNTEPLTPTDKEQMETAIQKNTNDITDLKANKQDKLISGVNIKTINNESILSGGNLTLVEEEADPIFTNSPAYSITDEDITYWNNKANMSDIPDVSNFITKDVDDLTYYTKSTDMQIAINNAVGNERTARENADNSLQNQIDAITVSSDVVDVVSTYQDLVDYDTQHIKANDIIKVMQDSTHDNAISYYRWVITNNSGSWEYVGSEGPYYTKSETDTLLNAKQNTLVSGQNIKTINNESLLGEGNINIQSGGGTSDYADLSNKPKINNVELVGNKSLNDLGIQPVGNYALESDMTEAQNDIEALQTENARLKATLPTTTGEGQDVTLDKTAEMEFVKPPLPRGNTKQNTTTGKNLYDYTDLRGTVNFLTYDNDGWYTAVCDRTNQGTGDYFNFSTIASDNLETDTTYSIVTEIKSFTITGNGGSIHAVDRWGQFTTATNALSAVGVHVQTDTTKSSFDDLTSMLSSNIYVQANSKVTVVFRISVIKGTDVTVDNFVYEPYTGGQPAPSPSYPQEIRNVTGNVEVTISNENNTESKTLPVSLGNIELCKIGNYEDSIRQSTGKNLFDRSITPELYSYNSSGVKVSDTDLCINQELNNIDFSSIYVNFSSIVGSAYVRICEYNSSGTFIKRTIVNTNQSLTLDSNTKKIIFSVNASPAKYFTNLMINEGTTALPYEPYGKVWYKYGAVGKVVLDGSENWGGTSFGNYYRTQVSVDGIISGLSANDIELYSNYFYGNNGALNSEQAQVGMMAHYRQNNNVYFVTNESDYNAFKTWLNTHNTEVYYRLNTPTITEITDATLISQLEEISKALSYQGQTNITSNTIALFDVEAYQSTKLILENLDSRLTLVEG